LVPILSAHVNSTYLYEDNKSWILGNETIEARIRKDAGNIESFLLKEKGIELLPGGLSSGLAIEDVAKKKLFFDLECSKVEDIEMIKCESRRTLSIIKTFNEAAFRIKELFSLFKDHMKWEVSVKTDLDKEREVCIYFVFPCFTRRTHLFLANHEAPIKPEDFFQLTGQWGADITLVKHRMFEYGGRSPNITVIPAATIFNPEKDYGITFLEPLDVPKSLIQFFFLPEKPETSFVIVNRHLRLGPRTDAYACILIKEHEGDWRPGLSWILEKYPEYFKAEDKNIFKFEGSMLCDYINPPQRIEQWLREGLKWQEIHFHFPFYGLYAPKKKEWTSVTSIEAASQLNLKRLSRLGRRGPIYDAPVYKVSEEDIRRYINFLHQKGVAAFMYYQIFECNGDYAEENFKKSIVTNELGRFRRGWMYTYLMNPDPKYRWFKHLLQQIERLLIKYPNCDGLFLDRADYRELDFSHDDGVTMVENRPCYMIGFGFQKAVEQIANILHERGKSIWTNGPTSIEATKRIDGVMAEGHPFWLKTLQYLCLIRPLIFLPLGENASHEPRMTERNLKLCLEVGAYPHVTPLQPEEYLKKNLFLFDLYLPLLRFLNGRRWVLTAHALKLPERLGGNIFQTSNGHYVVTLISWDRSLFDSRRSYSENLQIRVSLKDAGEIKEVYLLSVDYKDWYKLSYRLESREIIISVPWHSTASMILLVKEKFEVPHGINVNETKEKPQLIKYKSSSPYIT